MGDYFLGVEGSGNEGLDDSEGGKVEGWGKVAGLFEGGIDGEDLKGLAFFAGERSQCSPDYAMGDDEEGRFGNAEGEGEGIGFWSCFREHEDREQFGFALRIVGERKKSSEGRASSLIYSFC